MNEQEAMNRKCCFAFNTNNQEFDFCLTSRCMAWDESRGGCLMLFDGACDCNENKTACGKE